MESTKTWACYILQCADKTLYTGITNQLETRLIAHNEGKGAKYTKGRGPVTLLYAEPCPDRAQASQREAAIKKLSREQKLKLCGINQV